MSLYVHAPLFQVRLDRLQAFLLLQLSCPRRQVQLCNPFLSFPCWSAHVSEAFAGMRDSLMFKQRMLEGSKVPLQGFIADLRHRLQKIWREADDLDPRAVNRKTVTYQKCCGKSFKQRAGSPLPVPSYLCMELKRKVIRNVSRFRPRAHDLKV